MDTAIGPCRPNPPGPGGFGAAVWRQLHPPLLRLSECARFVAALRMDYWLVQNRPWWETPDLLGDEETIWCELRALLPEFTPLAEVAPGQLSAEVAKYVQRCRWAAIRTVAAAVGILAPTYQFLPALGGDAAAEIQLHGVRVRVGKLAAWAISATPTQSDFALSLLTESPLLSDLERIYFPFLADAGLLETNYARWSAFAPLRNWQSAHRFPLRARVTRLGAIPPGYSLRYEAGDLTGCNIPLGTAAGISSPLVADCLEELFHQPATAIALPDDVALLDWALERERAFGSRAINSPLNDTEVLQNLIA